MSTEYTCPMHPEVIQDHPGSCPICGMALESKSIEIETDDTEYQDMLRRFLIASFLSLPLLFLEMGSMFLPIDKWISPENSKIIQFFLSSFIVLWAGFPFFVKGYQSVVTNNLNMFSLIALGVGTAYIYSCIALFFPGFPIYFESASIITVLVLLGQVLELKARGQTSHAIKALLERAASSARVQRDGQEIEIPIEEVIVDDILHVLPGDKIPVDGLIIEGKSLVDESMITGESIPVEKSINQAVIGGTINQRGSFLMRAKKVGSDTLLSQIVKMVAESARSRAPIQSLADKVSAFFVPTVIFIAILTFILWALIGKEPLFGLLNAVAVLIIACPCALGLATPMSIMVGMGKGAEAGILIKDAASLEKLEKVKTILIDKTGTLTLGKPKVTSLLAIGNWTADKILRLASSLEQNSEHPLASAILQETKDKGLTIPNCTEFTSITGGGITGFVENHNVILGNSYLLKKENIQNLNLLQEISDIQQLPTTTLYVAIDGKAAGLISVNDPIKLTTQKAIDALHTLGLRIIMLTGDNKKTANDIAHTLGIDEVHAEILPQEKQEFVKRFIGQKNLVAMAGDGINDAPALAAADVGIAMGTGTDVAMESADVTLVKGDLMGITKAIRLSLATMKNIRQNLFFAFIYNVIGIPIAAGLLYPFTGWLLNPMLAALAMSLSSVSVILNSLRLSRIKL